MTELRTQMSKKATGESLLATTPGPNPGKGSIAPARSYQGQGRRNACGSGNPTCPCFSVIPPYPPVLALTPEVASPPLIATERMELNACG